MIHSRVVWMSRPVERSMTVSAPHCTDHVIFSTSSAIEEVTDELPMLALIFTRKLRPMAIGSASGWLTLLGMMARPRATSSRTKSGASPSRSRDELHLGGDDSLAGVVHLGDGAPGGRRAAPAGAPLANAGSDDRPGRRDHRHADPPHGRRSPRCRLATRPTRRAVPAAPLRAQSPARRCRTAGRSRRWSAGLR